MSSSPAILQPPLAQLSTAAPLVLALSSASAATFSICSGTSLVSRLQIFAYTPYACSGGNNNNKRELVEMLARSVAATNGTTTGTVPASGAIDFGSILSSIFGALFRYVAIIATCGLC